MALLRRSSASAVLGTLALAALGCGGYYRLCTTPHLEQAQPADVEVTFLGVAGFLIRYDGLALMTAPFYSNPTLGEIASQPTRSDHRLVDALLPRVDDVSAILVGHSHYDHLMDVPYVATHRATSAEIVGNDAMARLLAPWNALEDRVVPVELSARWLEKVRNEKTCPDARSYARTIDERIRVWPILSEHSSQFKIPLLEEKWFPAVHLWRGDILLPLKDPPLRAGEWVEGTTLAYLIDLLDRTGTRVVFRIYYQDSGSRKPFGFPPACVLEEREVDLALLCTGGSSTLRNHPAEVVSALKPRFTMAAHWEDFFNPRQLPLPTSYGDRRPPRCERFNEVYGAKVKAFVRQLHATIPAAGKYAVPCPDAVTLFQPAGVGWDIRESSESWMDRRGRVVTHPAEKSR